MATLACRHFLGGKRITTHSIVGVESVSARERNAKYGLRNCASEISHLEHVIALAEARDDGIGEATREIVWR